MTPFCIAHWLGATVPSLIFERMLDVFFCKKRLGWVTKSTDFLVICHLYLLDGSSSVFAIFAELNPSLLSCSGASTIIVVEGSQLLLKGSFRSFLFEGPMVQKGAFLFVIYPTLLLNLT